MITHPLLLQQVRLHLGDKPKLSGRMSRLLMAVEAAYQRLEPHGAQGKGEASLGEPSLRMVFARMAEGVLVRDIEDRIIGYNPAAERILSFSFDQICNFEHFIEGLRLVREDGRPYSSEDLPSRLTLRDGKARYGIIIGWMKSGEMPRWLSFNSEPLHDSNGKVVAAVSTFSDVTEIVQSAPKMASLNPVAQVEAHDRPRPTMAMIARRLNVSAATVSMALHRHPRISLAMQQKVQAMADELGYRPDPLLRRAMSYLRHPTKVAFKANICALTDFPSLDSHYIAGMIESARARAELLGYGFFVQQINRSKGGHGGFDRMLFSRGVEGLLLLPMSSPLDCRDLLDWNRYSVVTVSYGVRGLRFDMIASHWFASMQGALGQLVSFGYRRIGIVLNKAFDLVINHKFSAAVAAVHKCLEIAPLPPFYYCARIPSEQRNGSLGGASDPDNGGPPDPSHACGWPYAHRLREWYQREQPDVLLLDYEAIVPKVLSALELPNAGEMDIAVLLRTKTSRLAGWEERPDKVGEMAVDAIDHKIRSREIGEAPTPFVKMVVGSWAHGVSLKQRQPVRSVGTRPCPAAITELCGACVGRECPLQPSSGEVTTI